MIFAKNMFKQYLMFLILLMSPEVFASRSYEGPISASMGGTGRAAVVPGETNLNPASLAFLSGYQGVASYRSFALDPFGNISDFKVSISDNHTENIFPAALVYAKHRTWEGNIGKNEEEMHLSISKFYFEKVSFGFDIERYSMTPDTSTSTTEWDSTFGAIYSLTLNWGLGFVAQNYLPTNSTALISKFGLATAYNFENVVRIQFDLLYPSELNENRRFIYMAGFESHYIKDVGLRFGFRLDDVEHQNHWTLGIGWTGPKIALDYAFEKNTQNQLEMAHSVDLRIYF